jgi:hypothetical protein
VVLLEVVKNERLMFQWCRLARRMPLSEPVAIVICNRDNKTYIMSETTNTVTPATTTPCACACAPKAQPAAAPAAQPQPQPAAAPAPAAPKAGKRNFRKR